MMNEVMNDFGNTLEDVGQLSALDNNDVLWIVSFIYFFGVFLQF